MLASGTTPDDRASGAPRRTTARHSRLLPGGDLSGRPTGRATRSVRNRRAAGDGTGRASQRRLHGTPSPRLTGPPAARAARHPVDQGRPVAGPRQPERAVTTGTTGHPAPTLRKDRRETERIVGTGQGRREWGWRQRRPHLHWAGALGGRCMGSAPHAPRAPGPTEAPRANAMRPPSCGGPCDGRYRPPPHRCGPRPHPSGPPSRTDGAPRWAASRTPGARSPSHLAKPPKHFTRLRSVAKRGQPPRRELFFHHFSILWGNRRTRPALRICPETFRQPPSRGLRSRPAYRDKFILFNALPMDSKDVPTLQKWPENLTESRRKGQVNHCRSQKRVTMPLCNQAFSTASNAVPEIALKYR